MSSPGPYDIMTSGGPGQRRLRRALEIIGLLRSRSLVFECSVVFANLCVICQDILCQNKRRPGFRSPASRPECQVCAAIRARVRAA